MALDVESICRDVLGRITPKDFETEKTLKLFNEVREVLEPVLKELNYPFKITLEGSVSKNTHLSGETDLDIFILIRYDHMSREWLESLIGRLAHALRDYRPRVLYASHPYLKILKDGIEADVVPAFMAYDISEIKTAVDRTPFHTQFVKSKLTGDLVNEVRLLKRFFKGINVYGAEIKVEGFSGYLTELLIIYYGSFLNTLKNIAKWSAPQVIDMRGIYRSFDEYVRVYGSKPLIVVDPVDPRRNAAAAVSLKSFSIAILAARKFLEKPSLEFFFPKVVTVGWDHINEVIKSRETCITGYLVNYGEDVSPDIIWGELKKCAKRGINILREHQFNVVDYGIWCNERGTALILYEVLPQQLPPYTLHLGPKVFREEHATKFLHKYLGSGGVVGPWVNDYGELVVMKLRRYRTPYDVLTEEGVRVIQARHVSSYSVVKLTELRDLYEGSDGELRSWLTSFILKKPSWLT